LVDRGDTNGIRAGTRRELPIILSGKAKDDCLPGMTLSFRATPPLRSPPSTRLGSVADCPVAYNHRGTDPHALGGLKAAVADFDRGFELAPGYAEASKKTKSRGASHDRAEMKSCRPGRGTRAGRYWELPTRWTSSVSPKTVEGLILVATGSVEVTPTNQGADR
jgi:hypothetical protein